MQHQTHFIRADWGDVRPTEGLPSPLDSETNALLRLFLAPILEKAPDWSTLALQLGAKGYDLCFREGHLVILNDLGDALCTGSDIGVPMARIAERIGRPCVRAHRDGHSGVLCQS